MKKIGLIGCGTIGRYIYEHLKNEAEFAFIYDAVEPKEEELKKLLISTPAELEEKCAAGVDLVVEAAVAKVVIALAPTVLKYSDFMAFSTTAFAEEGFPEQVHKLCEEYGHTFLIPHGAILGLDGIFDGRTVLESVKITTTKKPKNLGRTDKVRTVLYEGPTRGACKAYPRNVNVHAGIAMAGLGFEKTQSVIIADPDSPGNTHKIEIEAEGCRFTIDVLSKPVSGVTGAYTPVSACSSVRRALYQRGIVIG